MAGGRQRLGPAPEAEEGVAADDADDDEEADEDDEEALEVVDAVFLEGAGRGQDSVSKMDVMDGRQGGRHA